MKQKVINQTKLQTLLCVIALTIGVLVSAVLFSMPPVHAEESWTLKNNSGTYDFTGTYTDQYGFSCSNDYHLILNSDCFYAFVYLGESSFVSDPDVKGRSYRLYYYNSFSKDAVEYTDNNKYLPFFPECTYDYANYQQLRSNYFNSDGEERHDVSFGTSPFTVSTLVTTGYGNKHVIQTFSLPLIVFDSKDSMLNYCLTGDKSGLISEPVVSNTTDEAYTFTGFSISGKTARWTGTTERSYLKDQEVEEYTTITYAWATNTEPDNIGTFQEYDGEFPTSAKQLKLPWSDMESGKNDGEFIRQVNITPCYRASGQAFYHGVGVKIFYKSDGTVERTELIKKPTDLNTGNMVFDSSIGYLQNVIYTEEKTHDGTGRQATFKWSTSKTMPSDAQVEIVAKNFYIEWFNKTTEENFIYKEYGEDCIYSEGSYSFNANTPVWTWLKEKEIDPFSIKTQSYGTKEYYLRIITYSNNDNMYHYGGWVRVNVKTKNSTEMPTTDVETGGFDDDSGLWNKDLDSDDSYHYSTDDKGDLTGDIDIDSWEDLNINSFTWMYRNLQAMAQTLGQLPSMISAIFGFLPSQVITAIGVLLIAVVLMRFLGR